MNVNYPAVIDVRLANFDNKGQMEMVNDKVLLSNSQDLMAIEKATKQERPHATGKTIMSLLKGNIDIGNIRAVDYNSLEEYKSDNVGDNRFLVVINKKAIKGSVLVAPFWNDLKEKNNMFAYKDEIVVAVYQKDTAEDAIAQAAEDINVGAEILKSYKLY